MPALRRFRRVAVVTGVLLATLLPASPVRAATITVTTVLDEYDTVGTGAGCSLREAVQAANSNAPFGGCPAGSDPDQITLPAGTYGFSLSGSEALPNNAIGDLDVDGTLTIIGQDHPTIDANDLDRIFELTSGDSLALRGLSLTDGKSNVGGAIGVDSGTLSLVDVVASQNEATGMFGAHGGAIAATSSAVSIVQSRITTNSATSQDTFYPSRGGGIYLGAATTLTLTDSLIDANTATDLGGGIAALGAATTLTNVTISSNRAIDGDGIAIVNPNGALLTNVTIAGNGLGVSGKGGGMYADPRDAGDVIALENVTFSNNLGGATGGSGGSIYVEPAALGSVTARNTIAAHPLAGGNCGGKSLSYTNGHNLEFVPAFTSSPCFSAIDPTTVFGNPMFPVDGVGNIAPPADNGGPTPTIALGAGSAAVNAGIPAFGVTSDQRGAPRPYGSAPDIGAYERSFCGDVLIAIVGTAGNDTLTGTAGSDGILGLGGNDVMNGLGARDGLCGGAGNDVLDGSTGNDYLDGGANNDTLMPGTGVDRVIGGSNVDTVSYSASATAVSVDLRLATGFATGQGRDTISGIENVVGSRFADVVRGSGLGNWLRLGAGADYGFGYGGPDRIDGGPGNDRLFGGTGNDALYGEAGNDSFNGESGRDLCRQGPGTGRRISCERR